MSFHAPQLTREDFGEANLRLGKLEAEENVTILFAVESGSRAWGFPSHNSDLDVRYFFTRPISHYLGLREPRDVIERPIDGLWDINGWDLRKALQLLVKGNATATEWLSSPLIYREHGPFPYRLRDLIKRNASPRASARHYYGLTKNTYLRDIASKLHPAPDRLEHQTDVRLKSYFYSLRGACSIAWIRRYDEVPPMNLPALLSHDIVPDKVRAHIDALMRRKANMGEVGTGLRIMDLDDFIEEQIMWVKDKGMDVMPEDPVFEAEAQKLLLDALGVG